MAVDRWLMSPDERFQALVDEFVGDEDVGLPGAAGSRGFGAGALKVHGAIFAMLSHGRLVVKLPRGRVATLIADGTGGPFDAGKGRPMKEWLTVSTDAGDDSWLALAREALVFGRQRGR
jgi:hypothetical protein